jgi:hypothetical protein
LPSPSAWGPGRRITPGGPCRPARGRTEKLSLTTRSKSPPPPLPQHHVMSGHFWTRRSARRCGRPENLPRRGRCGGGEGTGRRPRGPRHFPLPCLGAVLGMDKRCESRGVGANLNPARAREAITRRKGPRRVPVQNDRLNVPGLHARPSKTSPGDRLPRTPGKARTARKIIQPPKPVNRNLRKCSRFSGFSPGSVAQEHSGVRVEAKKSSLGHASIRGTSGRLRWSLERNSCSHQRSAIRDFATLRGRPGACDAFSFRLA